MKFFPVIHFEIAHCMLLETFKMDGFLHNKFMIDTAVVKLIQLSLLQLTFDI